MLDFRILGPLEVLVDGQPVSLGPRQRSLLIALLLARGNFVGASRLADLVWGERGARPAAWPATLRSHVHHLRRAIAGSQSLRSGHEVLTASRLGDGFAYALRAAGDQVDAWRAERLLRQARAALRDERLLEASTQLGQVLDLWRGDPLADAAGMGFAADEAQRLRELHRGARLAKAEADIGLGLHHEVVGELESMLVCWPEDELARRLLAVSLHRAGRVADAARVCREGIELMLAHGLDVTGLRALQTHILASA